MNSYSHIPDTELALLLRDDDNAAFTEIYKRYWKKLLQIAWNHSQRDDVAKDIVHEVFMSLWERRHAVDIQLLAGFLITSVKFQCYKYHHKLQRQTVLAKENYHFTEEIHDEKEWDAAFLNEFINDLVEEMPEKCRLIFRYSRNEGLNNKEIAEKINISEKGVENTLGRALKIIRNGLKNYGLSSTITISILRLLFK